MVVGAQNAGTARAAAGLAGEFQAGTSIAAAPAIGPQESAQKTQPVWHSPSFRSRQRTPWVLRRWELFQNSAQDISPAAQSAADKDFYGHKCEGLDIQIDALVYELYGLTPEEIKIVEGIAA